MYIIYKRVFVIYLFFFHLFSLKNNYNKNMNVKLRYVKNKFFDGRDL